MVTAIHRQHHVAGQPSSSMTSSYSSSHESCSSDMSNTISTSANTTTDDDLQSGLCQLVYTSSASRRDLPHSDLSSILTDSRVRNATDDITGILLYRDGSFAQFLEGPTRAVHATFERIKNDTRHRGVIVVLNRSIEKRDFPDWRMGYRDIDFHLKQKNMDETQGQIGGTDMDDAADSAVFDLAAMSAKELTPEHMSTSTRALIRVFYRSLARP